MTTPKTLDDYIAALNQAGQSAADHFDSLPKYIAALETEIASTTGIDIDRHILAEIKLDRALQLRRDNSHVRLEDVVRRAKDNYLPPHVGKIVPLMEASLAEREKSKTRFLKSIGEKAASITAAMFAAVSTEESDKLLAQRQKAEDEAQGKLIDIANAKQAIAAFRVSPDSATFGAALARVNEVNFQTKN
jgi:hypothetical protein